MMTPTQARERAEELADELYPDLSDRGQFVPLIARALLLAQAEAVEECVKVSNAVPIPDEFTGGSSARMLCRGVYGRAKDEITTSLRRAAEETK